MNYIRLSGGLGNQLFQYCFGEYLRECHGCEVSYQFYHTKNKKVTRWSLELEKIIPELPLADSKKLRLIDNRLVLFLLKRVKTFSDLLSIQIERGHGDIDAIINNIDKLNNSVFVGYWQNLWFANKIRNELLDSISYDKIINNEFEYYVNDIKNNTSVSLHIRRGDYKGIDSWILLSEKYYSDALNLIKERLNKDFKVFVFSDDHHEARKILEKIDYPMIYVDRTKNALEDFYLMSLCDHNVIANSTFSLWPAFLNSNESKICISPSKWNNDRSYIPVDDSFITI